jgi:hypothetical protein
VVLFLLLAWHHWPEAIRLLGFFAAAACLVGALPGLLNGLIGTLNGLLVGRHRGGCPVELVPLLLLILVWVWDREDPKVGFTLLFSLIPAAFVWTAGFLGQAIGIRGRTAQWPRKSTDRSSPGGVAESLSQTQCGGGCLGGVEGVRSRSGGAGSIES